ncbi:MAG: hypothetical protein LBT29_08960 [Flavobacteriaceae bacterium]|jgi:hypothetical protein|nr:hypothetical protein [Flavobacteriaceae bacterium]
MFCVVFFGFSAPAQNSDGKKIDPEEIADKQIDALDKLISLDDFQKVELHDILVQSARQMKDLLDLGQSQEDIRFAFENSQRDFENRLKDILTAEQYDNYVKDKREKAMNPDNKSRKDKKDKKDKKQRNSKAENNEIQENQDAE